LNPATFSAGVALDEGDLLELLLLNAGPYTGLDKRDVKLPAFLGGELLIEIR
jgi:hypothetical protein